MVWPSSRRRPISASDAETCHAVTSLSTRITFLSGRGRAADFDRISMVVIGG